VTRPALFAVTLRLAVRNAVRRRGEALLVVLGSLLGTAIITSSFVVGDTLHATIRSEARTRLGPIDEVVLLHRATALDAVLPRLTSKPLPHTDGVLAEVNAAVAVTAEVHGQRFAEPDAFVQEVDFDAARRFGPDPGITGLADAGPTPSGDEAVIGADLASALHVDRGATLHVDAYGVTRSFTVRAVLPRVGVAGFHPGFQSAAFDVFLPPGTLAAMAVGAPAGALPPEARVLVSNDGGVYDSTGPTDAVMRELSIRTAGTAGVEVIDEKQQTLAFADRQGQNFARLFGLIGSFTVVAGVLLLVNIFVMLAEERKAELGTLRALGFNRRQLVRVLGFEGTAYSVVASAVGAVAGIGVGRVVVQVTSGIFAQGRRGITDLEFAVRPASLLAGFAIGLVIALATVWLTSARISRLNIIRAIRDAPEPPHHAGGRRALVVEVLGVLAGAAVTGVAVRRHLAVAALLGPSLAGLCLVPLLSRVVRRRVAVSVPMAALLVYSVGAFTWLRSVFDHADIAVFFVQGIVLVLSGVVLAVMNDDQFHWVSDRLSARGGGLATRLGLANPLAKRVRTGLLLAMYALVVFVLVFMAVFAAVFQAQAPRLARDAAAGYDLRVDSSPGNPTTAAQLQDRPGVDLAIPLLRATAQFQSNPDEAAVEEPLTGFDAQLLARGIPKLSARDGRFASDEAAWRAVLSAPDLVIVPANFTSAGGGPPRTTVHAGDRVTLIDPASGHRRVLTVAGVDGTIDVADNGAMVASSAITTLVDRASASRFYVAVDGGADATRVASALQADLVGNGVKADTFRALVDDRLRGQAQFIALLEGFLSLGLLIGIAGLGVVMVRAVRERRREIGMLRAMGFPARVIRRAFMVEAAFIAVQGIVVGTALGLVTGFSVLSDSTTFGDQSLPFAVPWVAITVLAAVALAASLLAVAAPAAQASRIRPAVALRIAD